MFPLDTKKLYDDLKYLKENNYKMVATLPVQLNDENGYYAKYFVENEIIKYMLDLNCPYKFYGGTPYRMPNIEFLDDYIFKTTENFINFLMLFDLNNEDVEFFIVSFLKTINIEPIKNIKLGREFLEKYNFTMSNYYVDKMILTAFQDCFTDEEIVQQLHNHIPIDIINECIIDEKRKNNLIMLSRLMGK